MKKIIYILIFAITLFVFPTTSTAADFNSNVELEYFDNGYYLITTLENEIPNQENSFYSTSKKSITKSKTAKFYNSKNEVQWYVKVTGTFTYGNGQSKCTNSSVSTKAYGKTWKIVSQSSTKSGNTATGKATAKQYFNNSVINTINKTVKLSCSSTGKVS